MHNNAVGRGGAEKPLPASLFVQTRPAGISTTFGGTLILPVSDPVCSLNQNKNLNQNKIGL